MTIEDFVLQYPIGARVPITSWQAANLARALSRHLAAGSTEALHDLETKNECTIMERVLFLDDEKWNGKDWPGAVVAICLSPVE